VLKADAFYFTLNKTFSHKKKKVSLVKTKIGTAQHYTRKDHAFGILDPRTRKLHVMCVESEALMHEWIKALIAVRTTLEGRARETLPQPALALNARFPNIPSLPPKPRRDDAQKQRDMLWARDDTQKQKHTATPDRPICGHICGTCHICGTSH